MTQCAIGERRADALSIPRARARARRESEQPRDDPLSVVGDAKPRAPPPAQPSPPSPPLSPNPHSPSSALRPGEDCFYDLHDGATPVRDARAATSSQRASADQTAGGGAPTGAAPRSLAREADDGAGGGDDGAGGDDDDGAGTYNVELFNRRAVELIDEHDGDRPFFLCALSPRSFPRARARASSRALRALPSSRGES